MKAALFLIPISLFATTTVSIDPDQVGATQAIIKVNTDQVGNCTYRASEGTAIGTLVNDVNPVLFATGPTDARGGSIPGSTITTVLPTHIFPIGRRAQRGVEVSTFDNLAYSRALQQNTQHIVGVTCGSDAEVTALFTTINPSSGVTTREPQFFRARPGDIAFPSLPWSTRGKCTIDPETGACVKLAALPGDFFQNPPAQQLQTFLPTLVGGSGWTGSAQNWTYTGVSQGYLYLPITPVSTASGNTPLSSSSTSGPTWVQFIATMSGTAPSVNVYLTVDGVTPISAAINVPITATATSYTVGTQVAILESWRNGPRPPLSRSDVMTRNGTVTKSGTTVTVTGGDPFLPTRWGPGSTITLNGNVCVVSQMVSDMALNVVSSSCASDGTAIAYSATNFGFLVQSATNSNLTVNVQSPSWLIGSSGYVGMPATGFLVDICSAVNETGPTGPGNLCAPAGGFGPPNNYGSQNPIFWIGQDGTVNLIGISNSTNTPSGFLNNIGGGTVVFDGHVAAKMYFISGSVGGHQGIISMTYSGSYGATNPGFQTPTTGLIAAPVTTDISALVRTFDTSGNYAAYATQFGGGDPGWQIASWQDAGTNGALLLWTWPSQDLPGWWAIYSLDSNTIIAALCTYCGASGSNTRWMGNHSGFGTREYTTMIMSSGSNPGYVVGSTGTLGPPPWDNCPANSFGATGANCSTISISSLTPTKSGSPLNLASGNAQVILGDYFQFGDDSECVRVIALSGFSTTVWRDQEHGFQTCIGYSYSHATNSTLFMGAPRNELEWDWNASPTGTVTNMDPDTVDCHYSYSLNTFPLGCWYNPPTLLPGKPVRLGPFPANPTNPVFVVNFDAGFGNSWTTYTPSNDNAMQTHQSETQLTAIASEQLHFVDNRPYFGFGFPSTGVTKVGTYIYLVPASSLPNYNYRIHTWAAWTNQKPLVDISGPGVIMQDNSSNWYTYCYVLIAGECKSGSTAGQVYVNAPYVSSMTAQSCGGTSSQVAPVNDISIDEWYPGMNGVQEVAVDRGMDPSGRGVRLLTTAFAWKCAQTIFWNSREVAPGNWVFTSVDYLDGVNEQPILIKKPPVPSTSSLNLSEYIPVNFSFGSGAAGDVVRIEYGYAEYNINQLNTGQVPPCTTRGEGCFTDSSNSQPFLWASETQHGASCASGCTVTMNVLPAIGGRIVYFKRIRTNGANTTTGPLEIMMVGR